MEKRLVKAMRSGSLWEQTFDILEQMLQAVRSKILRKVMNFIYHFKLSLRKTFK